MILGTHSRYSGPGNSDAAHGCVSSEEIRHLGLGHTPPCSRRNRAVSLDLNRDGALAYWLVFGYTGKMDEWLRRN
jgi:hypothetical protein